MAFSNSGVTISIKSESKRDFVIGYSNQKGCFDPITKASPVVIRPGEQVHIFEPPQGVVITLKDRARRTKVSGREDADKLRMLAEEAYGQMWEDELARLAGKDARTIRRWLSGEAKRIPGPIMAMVSAHVLMVRNKMEIPA